MSEREASRRTFLAAVGAAGVGGLAGCAGFELQSGNQEPPLVENRPAAVYFPTHTEGMAMAGMQSSGDYSCALTYSFPHQFWTISGDDTTQVELSSNDAIHLMPVVWHSETGLIPSDVNPSVTVSKDGEAVVDGLNPWPMLSQQMGFHFGDNVELAQEGTHTATVSVGESGGRRTGSLADAGAATFEFTLDYQRSELLDLPFEETPEAKQGMLGAAQPMQMGMVPLMQAPSISNLPGTGHGTAKSGDAQLAVRSLEDATRFEGSGTQTYLAVSPRTPYNRFPLPQMSLSATLTRAGATVYDGYLNEWLDGDLGIHYGAAVDGVESGDELAISVDTPTQVARHEGYETAFLNMADATLTL